jgi:hypothetical protein
MRVESRMPARSRLERAEDVKTFQILGIFCCAGLLLSLLLAMNGWI